MLRPAVAPKSLERHFIALAAGVLLLVSVLAGILLYQNWQSYGAASEARQAFASVRATIRVMERASAERGPMNAALGSALPVQPHVAASLTAARAKTDGLIDALLALHPGEDGKAKRGEIQRIRQTLDQARQDVDRLIATPRDQLSGQMLWDTVSAMVRVIPQWQASLAANAGLVMRSEANAPSLLTLALLASELREQAGLLGSTYTPALSRHRKLTAEEQFRIERVLGRIDELHALIRMRMATHPDVRASEVYARMERRYFGDGLAYLERVREQASRQWDAAPVSTGDLAAAYVPMMGAITEFRDVLLEEMERHIDAHRMSAARLLAVTLAATALLVAALAVALVQFRKRVIQPFALATRIIGSIASGSTPPKIPPGKYHGEVEEVFNALRVLKENSAARKRLEAERDRLIADLAHTAETDYLTGLLNRRAFEKRFEAARLHWDESQPMLAFILFDIDHFKTINDTHGHASGDLALKAVAELCRATWRQSDVVARVGGEEFAVLCRTRGAQQAMEMAERMRAAIGASTVTSESGVTFGLTASFGVACISWSHAESASSLFRAADELLYLAKLNGRNQVQQRTLG
ncbi:MAG TPA: GGDEF domain-containing protein [Achromobacter sp.]|uniref:diguanylate cyclase n=1 Tax=Achromobacter sp. TaxID=134375 RepID=UPI000EBF865C|nr:diguanylate cyclase [Achromobacter sp.]HAP25769.1 GGDEF domain-containing protein [Achromobacter sp.]